MPLGGYSTSAAEYDQVICSSTEAILGRLRTRKKKGKDERKIKIKKYKSSWVELLFGRKIQIAAF